MRVLVVGSTNVIGWAVVERLTERGHANPPLASKVNAVRAKESSA